MQPLLQAVRRWGFPVVGGIIAVGGKINDAWDFVQLGLPSDAWVGIGLAVFFVSTIAVVAGMRREQERSRSTRQEQEQPKLTIAELKEIGGMFLGFLTLAGQLQQTPSPLTRQSPSVTPASLSGAVIRAGGLTTESSSTSTSPVDLATVAGLNIKRSTPFIVICQFRQFPSKGIAIGLKLNGHPIWQPNPQISPDDSTKGVVLWFVNGVIEAKNKAVQMYVPTTAIRHKNIRKGARPIQTIIDVSVSVSTNDHTASVSIQNVEVHTLPSDD